MPQYRNILPRSVETPLVTASDSSRQAPGLRGRQQRKILTRKRHSPEEWEAHKSLILLLYGSHELKDVIRIMKERTGFDAGIRRYKEMLATWGQEKYIRRPEMQFVVQKFQSRKKHQKKATSFIIRDTQFDNDQILRFEARSQTDQEGHRETLPFETTPEGIQYFTPRSPPTAWLLQQGSPHIFTPLSRHTASATTISQLSMSDTFVATIVSYDRPMETKQVEVNLRPPKIRRPPSVDESATYVQPRKHQRERTQGRSPLNENGNIIRQIDGADSSYMRHSHQDAKFAGVGNGRFTSPNQITKLLWLGLKSAVALGTLNSRTVGDAPGGENRLEPNFEVKDMPHYWLDTNTDSVFPTEVLIAQIKKSTLARKVLALTKKSYGFWLGNWCQLHEDDALMLKSVANHCFGDPFVSFPSLGIVSVIIKMESHYPMEESFLLRVTYGRESRSEFLSCAQCESAVFVLDFSGPSGALKLQVPAGDFSAAYAEKTLDDFLTTTTSHTKVVNNKISLFSYDFQGFHTRKHFRRCHCNGRTHESGFLEHYIDMEAEITAREEEFDPYSLNEAAAEEGFCPYPPNMDSRFLNLLIEDCSSDQNESALVEDEDGADALWDPNGDTDGRRSEEWDPYPSDDEANDHYVTQALFCRTKAEALKSKGHWLYD
ncbi:MAG: hypothetical protein Q9227_000726 [Pyrenula ochraceoflavens]